MVKRADIDVRLQLEAAERTVAVLKQRVCSLYDRADQTVIERQLEQARRRSEDNRRKRELSEVRSDELKNYSKGLEAEVARRTAELKTILDNVVFGFLLVDRTLTILPGATRSCFELLSADRLEGLRFPDVLSIHDASVAGRFTAGLEQMLTDILPWEVAVAQVPASVQVGLRSLRIDVRPVRDPQGSIERLLLTISDITAQELAEREMRYHRSIVSILEEKDSFRLFVQDTRDRLSQASDAIREGDQTFARRAVHTVKGNAGAFGMDELQLVAHEIENGAEIGASEVELLWLTLRGFLAQTQRVLEIDPDQQSGPDVRLNARQLEELKRLVERDQSQDLSDWMDRIRLRPVGQLVEPLRAMATRALDRLEKSATVEIQGADVMVDPEAFGPVLQSLSHLIRNSVDHGIERPRARGKKGPRGAVTLTFEDTGTGWAVTVRDDGKGIDLAQLAAKAVEAGVATQAAVDAFSPEQVLELSFVDGLSTALETSDLSGRGVGLSAVRAQARRLGGDVTLRSHLGLGTSVRVWVPKRRVDHQAPAMRDDPVAPREPVNLAIGIAERKIELSRSGRL